MSDDGLKKNPNY